ncbi:Helix-turn-helix domain-containing protein [Streptomyces sp. Ag82_O1-12]|uniref:ArsR/SmtB family transcription factor n=1 Tax=unclassified Streptomyces TaxID=2593676 RepID=UPI000BCB0345|nr:MULTISPECIES: winged helix-turn-helix domain-containing protein [unclassified Streptomyces]SMQ17384.1 Helix-turn-helix domain-containing protein [Streptomyces sp. Ag82_O1-12]SOD46418.1 Helix-turn-helix domain-containing protein [Streptomyces sp. Ag82_G6-1]
MELEQRVADLERRLAALEGAQHTAPRIDGSDFWALNGLREQLTEAGEADGGVLYTGSVRLPTGEEYAWQMAALTQDLLEDDWTTAAESFAALGHPVRIRLLREILGGRRTAAELAELDEVGTTGQIYHHLRQLTATGWLHTTGRGRHEVPPGRVVPLLTALTTTRP